jgi:hypothetical protein
MAHTSDFDPDAPVPTADALRMQLIDKELEKLEKAREAREAAKENLTKLADDFLRNQVSEAEIATVRRLVANAVKDGKLEAMVYSFPSDLCTDKGRAINSGDPNWPKTLQGKAKEMYDRYQTIGKPAGYKLKAMIINFPNDMPGDVGFFLNWAPQRS